VDRKADIAALIKGAAAAAFCPYPFAVFVGLLVSWQETMPVAKSPKEAILQAVTFIPSALLLSPISLLVTALAILIWMGLRWKGWAPSYVCVGIGALTGWVFALVLAPVHGLNFHIVTLIAGILTGAVVWLVSRVSPRRVTIEDKP
jgi:hypothetical protein